MAVDYGPKFGELVGNLIDASRYNDYVLAIIGRDHGLDVNLNPEEVWEEGHQLHLMFIAALFDDIPPEERPLFGRTTLANQGFIARTDIVHPNSDHPDIDHPDKDKT